MSDLVERLRERAEQEHEMLGDIHLPLLEAAAEITRLLGVISTLRGELRNAGCSCCRHWFDRSDMEASDDQA